MLFRSSLISLLMGSMLFDENPPPTPPNDTETDEEPADEVVTMTRAELDKRFQLRANKAARHTRKEYEQEIVTTLGVPLEDAKKIIAERKQREESEKSEAQKAREAADAEKAEAVKERAAAAAERHSIKVERALLKAGADPDKLAKLSRLVDAEPGVEDDALKTAVEEVAKDFPDAFGTSDRSRPRPVSSDAKDKTPPHKPTPEGGYDRGKQRAAARNPQPVAS